MANDAPKPICFMVMPFGVKETQTPGAPAKVNFDSLWTRVFKPVIEKLGYEPVRADVDLGASIIRDMIERLALSDLVLADVTIANANVFYEVGIRHAARESGCVLVAASWAKAPFDTQSMRREGFELAGVDVTDDEAQRNIEKLVSRVRDLADSKSPCYEMEGFPKLPLARAQAFRDWLREMNAFNAAVTAVRLEPNAGVRREKAQAMLAKVTEPGSQVPLAVAYELVKLARDFIGWKEVDEFIERLAPSVQELPLFVEQRALARSKWGDHQLAIAALLELVKMSGDSDERCGLIGGRYKKLWREARDQNPDLAGGYLDSAIEYYERGRLTDLNAYYSSSNLPLLLRARGKLGEPERAGRIATCVVAACERAIALKIADEWVYPTLLVAAFHTGEVDKARELLSEVKKDAVSWKLESVLQDLKDAVRLQQASAVAPQLDEMVAELSKLAARLATP
jgi:hypothetical protein